MTGSQRVFAHFSSVSADKKSSSRYVWSKRELGADLVGASDAATGEAAGAPGLDA